jgi:hypothetical protein
MGTANFTRGQGESCGRKVSSSRLGVAYDALNGGEAQAQAVFDTVYQVVHRAHGERRIDAAVKIDDLAVRSLSHAHVMNFAEARDARG